jgi:molybdopterin-containing oxidoreductase family iron-sulfur binding subunit
MSSMSNENKKPPVRWQSLEELEHSPAFAEFVENEFPQASVLYRNYVDRRQFLTLMAASFGLAGLTSCKPTDEKKIVPYVRPPEEAIPGKPLYFATTMPMRGYGVGLIAESHQGRPTKVEGNPDHPASLGASDCFAQASVLTLYDPDRSQGILRAGAASTWEDFVEAVSSEMKAKESTRGKGLRILTETVTSPTLAAQLDRLLKKYPGAAWHQYEPTSFDSERTATQTLFGRPADVRYNFEKASVILALDADFLTVPPGNLRYTKEFSRRRRPSDDGTPMNRLYVLESCPSLTGAMADHKLVIRSSDIPAIAKAIQGSLSNFGVNVAQNVGVNSQWIETVAKDLRDHRGECLVLAGGWQPIEVHLLAYAMNSALGNIGKTVEYIAPVEAAPVVHTESLRDLVKAMQSGDVDTLLVLGGNPVYSTPADLEFRKSLEKVRLRIQLSMYNDETSQASDWHIPEAHYLEAWGDSRAFDGTASVTQPLIDPLYGGKTPYEVVSVLLGEADKTAYETVQSHWQQTQTSEEFEPSWRRSLRDGKMNLPVAAPQTPLPAAHIPNIPVTASTGGIELVFRPDPSIFDGRFSNNSWLQELPKTLSKVSWDNVIQMSPATAQQLGFDNEAVIEIVHEGRTLKGPVWMMPGHADQSVTVFLGYGRTHAGTVGSGRGYNAYAIRTSNAPWIARGIELRKTAETHQLASTQHHHAMENRHAVRTSTVEDYTKNPAGAARPTNKPAGGLTLYPEHASEDYAWGMSIDLSACTGCNACVVACQSENNIPVVGKEEVLRSREMHWIRIDRYYDGVAANPATLFQPMFCQHCENAPCEPVCPVGATTHSAEGLNEMTYNRCVGTRYCSNNCPYKVRRFNFFQYAITEVPALRLLDNPNVTVRSRGVMEKCTYCVQRINIGRINAKNEDRKIRDGEVVTACQSVCPADAIVFGNIKDTESRVSKLKAGPRDYGVLEELNTRPRTTYLIKVTNPNPAMPEQK